MKNQKPAHKRNTSFPDYKTALKQISFPQRKKNIIFARIKTEIPGLDGALNGGFLDGSIVTVAGGAGSGKTVLCMQSFFARKYSGKSRGLILSFDEKEDELTRLYKSINLKKNAYVHILCLPPAIANFNEIFFKILQYVQEKNVKHILINSISSIGDFNQKETNKKFLNALAALFKGFNVNIIMSYRVSGDYISDGVNSNDYIVGLSDTVIYLSSEYLAAGVNRYLVVTKMRGSHTDNRSKKMEIDGKGVRISEENRPHELITNTDKYTVNANVAYSDIGIAGMLTEKFRETHDKVLLRIEESMPYKLSIDKVREEINNGKLKQDILSCDIKDVKKLAEEGLLLPLDPYFEKPEQIYFENILQDCIYKDKIYGLPGYLRPFCMMYRKDLLEKYGLDQPSDWQELINVINTAKSRDNNITAGLAYPVKDDCIFLCFIIYLLTDCEETINSREELFDDKRCRKVIQFMHDCVYKYKIVSKKNIQTIWETLLDDFINGKVLFLHCWSFDYRYMVEKDPSIKSKIGFMSFPKSSTEKHNYNLMSGSAYVIPSNVRYPCYAAEALEFLASFDVNKKVYKIGNFPNLSARKDVAKELEKIKDKPYFNNCSKLAREGFCTKDVVYNKALMDIFRESIIEVLTDRKKYKETISALSERLKLWRKSNYYDKAIHSAIRYMEKGYNQKMTLTEIAKTTNLSPNFFSKIFKENTNKTVFEYLTYIRIERAKILLKEEYKYNISQIAEKTGFLNIFHFTTVFKKHTGLPPTRFRMNYTSK